MKTKKAISLIVLVITIIVMIILAGAVIVTISNTDIIERARNAKEQADLKTMQELVQTLWADAYVAGARTKVELETAVTTGLVGVDTSKYDIDVRVDGVTVTLRPTGGEQEPELNEDGYYYNVPYVYTDTEEGWADAFVFYADGTYGYFCDGFTEARSAVLFCDGGGTYEYDESIITDNWGAQYTVAPDGKSFEYDGDVFVATGTEHGVYYGYNYVDADGNSFCFAENGAFIVVMGEETYYESGAQWSGHGHWVEQANLGEATVSIDGNTLLWDDVVYERGEEIERGTAEIAAGLYETGALVKYEAFGVDVSDMLITSWEDLLEDEIVHVENGVVYTNYNVNNISNNPSAGTLEGDLVLPTTGITTIGDCAFKNCNNLTGVVIPEGVTSIGYMNFDSCNNLTRVVIPDGVTFIDYHAFAFCDNLTEVVIPGSVTSIGDQAFVACENLTSVTFGGTVEQWDALDFGCNEGENSIEVTVICANGTTTFLNPMDTGR